MYACVVRTVSPQKKKKNMRKSCFAPKKLLVLIINITCLLLVWSLFKLCFFNNQSDQVNLNTDFSINDLNIKYPNLLSCSRTYNPWDMGQSNKETVVLSTYSVPASNETHKLRVSRAVLVYFPIESVSHFMPEFRWLYRSWIEMQKYEPPHWRTDLVIFLEKDAGFFKDDANNVFTKLNCKFTNLRSSETDKPMCTLIEFVPLQKVGVYLCICLFVCVKCMINKPIVKQIFKF